MSSNSEDENKIKAEKLNAGDAKIIFWIIIITIIITIILIIYFAIQSTGESGGDKPHTFPETKNVRTEKETYFCPYYAPLLGFWANYGFSCATVPEGYCFNYDKDDQIDEPEEDADDRENENICPTWIRVSYPLNEEDKLFVASWWEELIFGHPIMQDMFNQSNGEMYGWICEDDVEFTEECAVDSEGIDLSELVNDCQCSNGCGWTDVKVDTELISQNDGHHTYENTLWKHKDDPYVQGSGCSLVAVVNAARGLGMSLTVEEAADYSYNVAQIQNGGWDAVETLAKQYGLEITYMYDNVNQIHTSKQAKTDEEKINYVKQALASKKMVIASGTNPPIIGAGGCTPGYDCTFTNGGHFVAIVAATSDGKFIVANPGYESRSKTGWKLPQDGVAKYMDIVAAVGLEGSGELRNCSGQGEEEKPESDVHEIQITEKNVNVRKEPKTHQTELCGRKAVKGEVIEVENKLYDDESSECSEGWYKVVDKKHNYWIGCYICAKFAEKFENPLTGNEEKVTKYVNDKLGVKVRESNAASSNWVGNFDCANEVVVYNKVVSKDEKCSKNGWMKIASGKYEGRYVCSDYLGNSKPGDEVCNPSGGEEDPGPTGPSSPSGKTGKELLLECEKKANGKTQWGKLKYDYSKHQFIYPKSRATSDSETASTINPIFNCLLTEFLKAGSSYGVDATSSAKKPRSYSTQYANFKKYGCDTNRVACPGGSNHGWGIAVDLRYKKGGGWTGTTYGEFTMSVCNGIQGCKWAHEHAGDYYLKFRMNKEPWHIEPKNTDNASPSYGSCHVNC